MIQPKSCGSCVKRALQHGQLFCRAKAAVPDAVTGMGRWPTVRVDDFCHDDYEAEASPAPEPRARRARPQDEKLTADPELPL